MQPVWQRGTFWKDAQNKENATTTLTEHSDKDEDHVFTVTVSTDDGVLTVLNNDQPVKTLIDFGVSCNIVNMSTFRRLK